MHPAEASHGDLGMITPQDAVLALSNSGETTELRDLILYTRRFSIPLIGMVGRPASTLADAADLCLVLPEVGEACPMGLAPTTSTTCMLALGDALAVALLERRGFSARDFAVFHPGGKLGSQLLRVEQLMHQGDDLPLVSPDDQPRRRRAGDDARSGWAASAWSRTAGCAGSSPTAICAATWARTSSAAPPPRS